MSPSKSVLLAVLVSVIVTSVAFYLPHRQRTREAAWLRTENDRLRLEASRRRAEMAVTTGSQAAETTPLAALQAYAAACNGGEAASVAASLHFEERARTKALAFIASLPAELRGKWNGPEELAADLLISGAIGNPHPSEAVLCTAQEQRVGAGRVVLLLPGTGRDRLEFQQTGGRWKRVVNEAVVDDYLRRMARSGDGR